MQQEDKQLILYKNIVDRNISSVLSNVANDSDSEEEYSFPFLDATKDRIIVQTPLLNSFSDKDIQTIQCFVDALANSPDSI